MNKYFFTLVLNVCTLMALAQDEKMETDRPGETESVFTVPKNWFQFEAGLNIQETTSTDKEYLLPTLLSKYGLTKRFELRLITTIKKEKGDGSSFTGFEPVEIGGKWNLWEE